MEPTELTTERLLLRPFRLSDVDDVYAYASDEAWGQYLFAVPAPYTRQDAVSFVARTVLQDWEQRPAFAIQLGAQVVGGINLRIRPEQKVAEFGYSIARPHWGKGLVAEAASAVIDWGFQSYDIAKIYALADARNHQSIRVMEKLGMQREGLLRQNRYYRGEQVDEVLCSLLRKEWQAQRGGG